MEKKYTQDNLFDLFALNMTAMSNTKDFLFTLLTHPEIAELDGINYSRLVGKDWMCLVAGAKQYTKHCDWSKLNGTEISCLLMVQPQFADRCDWSKLNSANWNLLLRYQPQFEKYKR